MIIRILGEGQFEVAEDALDELNALDDKVEKALDAADDDGFRAALVALLDRVREVGEPLAADELVASDHLLPAADAHIDEVRDMLGEEGLIPG